MTLHQTFQAGAYEAVQENGDHYVVVSELTEEPGYHIRAGKEGFPPTFGKQAADLDEAETIASDCFAYIGPDAWPDNEDE